MLSLSKHEGRKYSAQPAFRIAALRRAAPARCRVIDASVDAPAVVAAALGALSDIMPA